MPVQTAEKIQIEIEGAPADLPALDKVEQQIREGDARSEKSEQHAEAAAAAHDKAADYSEKGHKLAKAAEDMLISAGLCYIEAQSQAQLDGRPWLETLEQFSHYTPRHVQRCMKIARSSNPSRAAAEHRAKDAADKKEKYTPKSENATENENLGRNSQDEDVEDLLNDDVENQFIGTVPSTDVIEPKADPVVLIMRWVQQLTMEQTLELRRRLDEHCRQLGVSAPKPNDRVLCPHGVERDYDFDCIICTKPAPKSSKPMPAPVVMPDRVKRAVDLFFASDKRLWLRLRMADPQPTTFKPGMAGPHIDWITTFWNGPAAEQQAIKEAIEIKTTRDHV